MDAAAVGPSVEKTGTMRVPLKSWAGDVEESALEQARNLARLPFALHHVALMPDAHTGYGMPIGGVFFADDVVVPYAVGVDIGCGVTLIRLGETDLVDRGAVENFLESLSQKIPVGNGPQAEHPRGLAQDDYGLLDSEKLLKNSDDELLRVLLVGRNQLGTLGGGNHFVELQRGADGRLYVMIHSGSRSVGKKICDRHYKIATTLMRRFRIELPNPNLAWLPWGTDEAKHYWNDMTVALEWAEENRRRMFAAVVVSARDTFDVSADFVLDVHHNYAAVENHFGRNGIVHRKGAVRARIGDTVLIPGSMGTSSYQAVGLGNPDSFMSCQHGAGRAMSRGAARRAMAARDLEEDLAGTVLVTPDRRSVTDEAPMAYKDVEVVMAASTDLVAPTMRFTPLGVLKG